ncbi:MAG TPA: pyridoxamine 5'-phosphate oxidase family protein [Terriglobia bacterium]|nr:pyridoxamine 5'-phosphate oxidase family protein [Terriglobia bacterium]
MAIIPKVLHEHINTAFPVNVCLVATALPDGFAQVTPRGSMMVFDDDHLAFWERGRGTTNANLKDGTKITVFFRKPELRQPDLLPKGGIVRFYGVATLHKSGPVYEQVWNRVIPPEKDRDPERKGFAVLVKIERAEDLSGMPLELK